MTPTHNGHSPKGIHGIPLPLAPERVEHPPSVPELAEVLSPSQVACFLGCSAKWFYRYALQIESPQGSALSLGKALHSSVNANYAQKISSFQDLPLAGVLAIYEEEWAKEAAVTQFQRDEKPDELKAMGRSLVTKYIENIAPTIEPAAVELPVEGVINGVPVRGIIDVLETSGTISDLKSAKASPAKDKIRPDYRFQIATYASITPGASGAARLDTVVKLKREVKLITQPFTVTDADRDQVAKMYPLAQEGMKSGYVFPNRNHYLCSRRYCAYASACCKDYGGEVL